MAIWEPRAIRQPPARRGSAGPERARISSSTASAVACKPPAPPERHKGKITRVMPTIDRDEANAVSHVRIGDAVDPERGRGDPDPQRARDRAIDHLVGELGLRCNAPPQKTADRDSQARWRRPLALPAHRPGHSRRDRARRRPTVAQPSDHHRCRSRRSSRRRRPAWLRRASAREPHIRQCASRAARRHGPCRSSAMSLEVPPTSMVMRSSSPASAPTAAPPSAPAAGPERNRRTGRKRAVSAPARPPRDCITCNGDGHVRLGEVARHVGEIAIDDRLDVGVKGGSDGALVFSKVPDPPRRTTMTATAGMAACTRLADAGARAQGRETKTAGKSRRRRRPPAFQRVDCARRWNSHQAASTLLSVGPDASLYFDPPCPWGEPTGVSGLSLRSYIWRRICRPISRMSRNLRWQ